MENELRIPKGNNINLIKFIFSLIVIIQHSMTLSNHGIFKQFKFLFDTNIAVRGFFILCGLGIAKSCWQSETKLDFFKKRVNRIYPQYIVVVLFFSILLYLLSNLKVKDYFLSIDFIKYIFYNVLFLNFMKPILPGVFENNFMHEVNGSLWTIKVQVMFYLIVPFLFSYIKNKKLNLKKINVLMLGLYLSTFLYKETIFYFYSITQVKSILQLNNQLPALMCYFSMGIFLMFNFKKIKNKINLFAVFSFIGLIFCYIFNNDYLYALSLGILVFWFSFGLREFKILGNYIKYSYEMYLIHFPLIQIFVHFGFFDSFPLISVVLILILTILFSILLNNFVGKYFFYKNQYRTNIVQVQKEKEL